MRDGFYTISCGCVKYTNRNTLAVRKGYELSGTWSVINCKKHCANGLSNFELGLQAEYLKRLKG